MKQIILITGASKGIGRAICRAFACNESLIVVTYYHSDEDAHRTADDVISRGADAIVEKADVTDYKAVKKMIDTVVQQYGRIDVLINNAGLTRDGFLMLMSEQDFNDVVDVNLKGVFNCSKAVSEHMISQKKGVIINVASLSGITGLAGQTNYSAAKGGVIAFTRALSKELAPFGIRVNAVAPGVIETDMLNSLSEKAKNKFLEHIPMKRFGSPEEVASVVHFLASEGARYITGEVISVTGGLP